MRRVRLHEQQQLNGGGKVNNNNNNNYNNIKKKNVEFEAPVPRVHLGPSGPSVPIVPFLPFALPGISQATGFGAAGPHPLPDVADGKGVSDDDYLALFPKEVLQSNAQFKPVNIRVVEHEDFIDYELDFVEEGTPVEDKQVHPRRVDDEAFGAKVANGFADSTEKPMTTIPISPTVAVTFANLLERARKRHRQIMQQEQDQKEDNSSEPEDLVPAAASLVRGGGGGPTTPMTPRKEDLVFVTSSSSTTTTTVSPRARRIMVTTQRPKTPPTTKLLRFRSPVSKSSDVQQEEEEDGRAGSEKERRRNLFVSNRRRRKFFREQQQSRNTFRVQQRFPRPRAYIPSTQSTPPPPTTSTTTSSTTTTTTATTTTVTPFPSTRVFTNVQTASALVVTSNVTSTRIVTKSVLPETPFTTEAPIIETTWEPMKESAQIENEEPETPFTTEEPIIWTTWEPEKEVPEQEEKIEEKSEDYFEQENESTFPPAAATWEPEKENDPAAMFVGEDSNELKGSANRIPRIIEPHWDQVLDKQIHSGQYHEINPGQYHEMHPGQYHEVTPGQYLEQTPGQYHEIHPGQYHEINPGQPQLQVEGTTTPVDPQLQVEIEVERSGDRRVYNVQSKVDEFIIGEYGTISDNNGQTLQGVRYTAIDDSSVDPNLIYETIKNFFKFQ